MYKLLRFSRRGRPVVGIGAGIGRGKIFPFVTRFTKQPASLAHVRQWEDVATYAWSFLTKQFPASLEWVGVIPAQHRLFATLGFTGMAVVGGPGGEGERSTNHAHFDRSEVKMPGIALHVSEDGCVCGGTLFYSSLNPAAPGPHPAQREPVARWCPVRCVLLDVLGVPRVLEAEWGEAG